MALSFRLEEDKQGVSRLRLWSASETNLLTSVCVFDLTEALVKLAAERQPLVICGNSKFFSAGADLSEIAALNGPQAYEFSKMGQALMNTITHFPAPVCAAIAGYCMGGGLDLALACHRRIASPDAAFGHRGAALGILTGWGGTQRLPGLIGRARALEMFVTAQEVSAAEALRIGLVDAIADDPEEAALLWLKTVR
jgi:enoyl-CoA hydratase